MSSFRILYFAMLSEILFKNARFISSLSSGKWLIPLVPFYLWETHSVQQRTCPFFCNVNRAPNFFQQCAVFEHQDHNRAGHDNLCIINPTSNSECMLWQDHHIVKVLTTVYGVNAIKRSVYFLLGLLWKSFLMLRIVLSFTSLPNSLIKWRTAFAGPSSIA